MDHLKLKMSLICFDYNTVAVTIWDKGLVRVDLLWYSLQFFGICLPRISEFLPNTLRQKGLSRD